MLKQLTGYEVIGAMTDSLKHSMYHTFPGIVYAFYAGVAGQSPACADIQVAVNDVRTDTDTGERIPEAWPIIPRVPIRYPKGGGYVIQFPLSVGDKVTLTAYDLDPTAHRASGKQADPIDVQRHSGSYWSCSADDITDAGAPIASGAAGSSLVIGKDGSPCQIVFDGTHINMGGASPTDFVALSSKVETELNKIKTALTTLVAPTGGGPCTGGIYVVGPVASALVASS